MNSKTIQGAATLWFVGTAVFCDERGWSLTGPQPELAAQDAQAPRLCVAETF